VRTWFDITKTARRAAWVTALVAGVIAGVLGISDRAHAGRLRLAAVRRSRLRVEGAAPAPIDLQDDATVGPIRVLLGEGTGETLSGLRSLLVQEGFEVVGTSRHFRDVVGLAARLRPSVVILDDARPVEYALSVAREIVSVSCESQLLLLSGHAAESEIVAAVRAGIRAYVLRADATAEIGRAIRDVSRGGLFLSAGAGRGLAAKFLPRAALASTVST